jgi:hypothetical protein
MRSLLASRGYPQRGAASSRGERVLRSLRSWRHYNQLAPASLAFAIAIGILVASNFNSDDQTPQEFYANIATNDHAQVKATLDS